MTRPRLRELLLDRAAGAAHEIALVERLAAVRRPSDAARCRGKRRSPGFRARPRARPRAPPRRRSAGRRPASPRPAYAALAPSMRNSGQIRSSVGQHVLATSRRAHSALRLRRGRCGSSRRDAAGVWAAFGMGRRSRLRALIGAAAGLGEGLDAGAAAAKPWARSVADQTADRRSKRPGRRPRFQLDRVPPCARTRT